MASDERAARARDLLERVSRVVEAHPGLTGREVRARGSFDRTNGDKALELLSRSGFIDRRPSNADDAYFSVKPYRARSEAPRTAFGRTHAAGQGGS